MIVWMLFTSRRVWTLQRSAVAPGQRSIAENTNEQTEPGRSSQMPGVTRVEAVRQRHHLRRQVCQSPQGYRIVARTPGYFPLGIAEEITETMFWNTFGIGAIRTDPVPAKVLNRPSPDVIDPSIDLVAF